ncbi:hypothetical protein ACFU7Y_15735 [Kitasatospora sp. NPDC057542]|uniref:hypothetical protein n=1 Tax=Streptomycetaceae TaxID=2062 RepID=UPI001CC9EE1A|nr:hypothetical protein [Streptomyces sp. LS1784]
MRAFDAVSSDPDPTEPVSVVIQDRRIKAIGRVNPPVGTVIEGGGRVLMPGLTDAHAHLFAVEFGCVSSDGRTVPVVIPSYVNPVLAVLVVCAVTLTVVAVVRSKEKST